MADTTKRDRQELPEPINTIWNALNSLPIAVGVIIILAILSAIGTLIPQEHLAQPPMGMTFDQMLIERFGLERFNLIDKLGLTHIYFTPYFFTLMLWLSVSAVVCTVRRIRNTYKQYVEPRVHRTARYFTSNNQAIVVEDTVPNAVEALKHQLHKEHFRTLEESDGESTNIYADKGYIQRWAVALIHVSVIILILGAVYGKIYGTEGYIRMPDGATKTLALDFARGKHRLVGPLVKAIPEHSYELKQKEFRIDYDRRIDLDDMLAELPEDMQFFYRHFVKDFVSELTISRNGQTVSREVKVNHPIRLGKLVLYQSGYQQLGYMVVDLNGVENEYALPTNMPFVITEDGPVRWEQAQAAGITSGRIFHVGSVKGGDLYVQGELTGKIGPMAVLEVMKRSGGEVSTDHVLITPDKAYEDTLDDLPVSIRMSEKMDNYSDFSYKLDPGIPVLYFGWILLTVGIFVSMYVGFTRAWFLVKDGRVFMLATGRGGITGAREMYLRWRDAVAKETPGERSEDDGKPAGGVI